MFIMMYNNSINMTEDVCKVVEKKPHTYVMTGKKLAEMCKFAGVVTSVDAESFTILTGDDKGKTGYRITVQTMERAEQA